MYVWMDGWMCVCMYVFMNGRMDAWMYIHMYVCMWDQVQSVLRNSASMVWSFNPPECEGAFTRLQVMVGARGHLSSGRFQEYDAEEDGIICRSMTQPQILQYATFSK